METEGKVKLTEAATYCTLEPPYDVTPACGRFPMPPFLKIIDLELLGEQISLYVPLLTMPIREPPTCYCRVGSRIRFERASLSLLHVINHNSEVSKL